METSESFVCINEKVDQFVYLLYNISNFLINSTFHFD